jgi:cytochrome c oxidase assembly protein subunit 15
MVVGLLILSTALLAWRTRRRPLVVGSAVAATLLLPLQVILGGLTVTELLEPAIVTNHLATATLILVALTTTTVVSWVSGSRNENRVPSV